MDKERSDLYEKVEQRTGNTHRYRISKIPVPHGNLIYAKEEWLNPTGSIFDRVYPFLFRCAEEKGFIVPGITPVIEASTGNAGTSFAWCARNLGYTDCSVIIHEDAPRARIKQIQSYGANIIFSPAGQFAKGYVKKLGELLPEDEQFKGGKLGEPKCLTRNL